MRFLLLCPVALLLLTAPAKTIPIESDEGLWIPTLPPSYNSARKPIDSSASPATTTQTASPEQVSVSPSTELRGESIGDQPDPKVFRKLRRRLAKALAELKALTEDNAILEANLTTMHSKMSNLVTKRVALATDLQTTRRKLREVQAKLNLTGPEEALCKPTESEYAQLLDEETKKQLEERKAEVKSSYEGKYEALLREVRTMIRDELRLN